MISLSRYEAGQVIIQENDLGETAYVIRQGQVEVSKEAQGQKVHLAYLGAGETFGEMSMIDASSIREKTRSEDKIASGLLQGVKERSGVSCQNFCSMRQPKSRRIFFANRR